MTTMQKKSALRARKTGITEESVSIQCNPRHFIQALRENYRQKSKAAVSARKRA